MFLKKCFYVSNSNQNIYSEKLQKKAPFFKFEKYALSAFTGKKINAVAILDRFAAHFETKLILASRRLVVR